MALTFLFYYKKDKILSGLGKERGYGKAKTGSGQKGIK